jgi:hypothetical protein
MTNEERSILSDWKHGTYNPGPPAACAGATGSVLFVIQRPNEFAEWFAGWNACGPMWTSSFQEAQQVRADLLAGYMVELAKHDPCASLL